MNNEFDIVKLLKAIRVSKLMSRIVLNKEERTLMAMQRQSVISSDSSEDPESDAAANLTVLV